MTMCVGAVDFLRKPAVAFVRLKDSVVMHGILEASVPVRFIFALVGPPESGIDFHESGRAMGTLLADWVRVAKKEVAKERYKTLSKRGCSRHSTRKVSMAWCGVMGCVGQDVGQFDQNMLSHLGYLLCIVSIAQSEEQNSFVGKN